MEWINSIEGIKAWWLTNANPKNSQHNAFLTNSLKSISKGVDVKVAKLGEDLVIVSMKKAGQDVINVREIKDEGQFIASLNELRSLNHVSFKEYLTSVDDALTYARYCALVGLS